MNRYTDRRYGLYGGVPGVAILLLAVAVAGCTLLPAPRGATRNTFVLRPEPAKASAEARACGPRAFTLLVNVPREEPGFDTSRMAYLLRPDLLGYYAESRWVDTPGRMLTPLLVQAMEEGGCWRAVIRAPIAADADYRLDTEDLVLEQEFFSRPARVRLSVRAVLVDVRRQGVVATRRFEAKEDAPSEDASGGADAANRAAGRLLPALAAWADQAVPRDAAPPAPAPRP
ncbi:MAG TPA: ABC-type transport auxiliary lipoprotein family protein [Candidatus Deferrimicrobiaceae bacterium]